MAHDFAKRNERFQLLNVGTTLVPDYVAIAAGVTSFDDALNPNVDDQMFIMDINSTPTVDSYSVQWAFEMFVSKTDEVAEFLRAMSRGLATGADAETELVVYDVWDIAVDFTVAAVQYRVAIAIDNDSNGEGGSKLQMSGTMYAQGDPVEGTFDTVTGVFTADAS